MLMNAKNGTLNVGGATVDYIRFGTGRRNLIILPGLGDGLQTVKGTALPMALMYRCFARDFTVYAFSRRNSLPGGFATRDMAADVAAAMDELGIERSDILGVSMGGMIAQYLAIDHPEKVGKLILTVTSAGPNPILEESISEWLNCTRRGDHAALMDSNLRRIYSEDYCRKNGWMVPLVGRLTKPRSYDRFYIQADACLTHNACDQLHRIKAPTLVIGGERDKALGADASREIAAGIPGSQLYMYEDWGHGLYEEAKDFDRRVLDFLNQ